MVIQLGPHQVEIENDIVITRLHGTFTQEQMKQWCRIMDGVIAEHDGAFSIGDYRGAGSIPPETRRLAGEWPGSAKMKGMVIFGASPVVRVIMTMIVRAGALLKNFMAPTAFVTTEAEARACVEELRAKKR